MTSEPTVRIGYLPTFYHTSHLLREAGWSPGRATVDWSLELTGPAIVRALASGDLDLAYIGLPPAMIAIARGVEIRCIAGGHEEGTIVIAAPDVPAARGASDLATTLRAIRPGPVGIPAAGSIHDVIFRELLRSSGLDREVEIRNLPQADLITEGLAAGTLRAGVGTPALAAAAARYAGARLVIPARALWPHNPSYGVVATAAALRQGELIEAFLRAHEEATALIRERPREAALRTARAVEVADAELIEAAYRVSPRYCAALSQGFVAATHRFGEVLNRLGYLPRPVGPEEVFRRAEIDRVHPEPPHYDAGIAP